MGLFDRLFGGNKEPNPTELPWFGPLSDAPADLLSRLEQLESFEVLKNRRLDASCSLLLAPRHRKTFDAEIAVLGTMHAWDDNSPVVWLFSTLGLSTIQQPESERFTFRRFEIVLATNNAEQEDPFPSRIGIALRSELPGWDWNEVPVPPLMSWLAVQGQELASMIVQDGSLFGIRDPIEGLGLGAADWTNSALFNAVLMPTPVQLMDAGFGPYRSPSDDKYVLDPSQWHEEPAVVAHENGFYWFLPTSNDERRAASTQGTWDMFEDLADRGNQIDPEDDFAAAFDLLRVRKT